MVGQRLRAVLGLAVSRLRHDRTRTILAVLGVTLAVLSTTLLGSLGLGVVETGQQKFETSDRDLWVSGGATRISPGSVGGFESGIPNAHELGDTLSQRDTITTAAPLLFQTVYVGSSPDSLETVVAVGTTADGGFAIRDGTGFGSDAGFYNDGAYNGTQNQNLVVGTQLQSQLDVEVSDQLYIGGTIVEARETTYNITGTTPTFNQFLGTPTVSVPLAELQAMTGNAYSDRASLITIDVAEDANTTAVANRLESEYPQYTIRTNTEQLRAIVEERILIVAAGSVLVALAALAGITLTINLLALLVFQEQEALAALRAVGISRSTVVGLVITQGLCYGILGATVGLVTTLPAAYALNYAASRIVGFQGLVQVTPRILAAGAVIALIAGFSSAIVAGWRAANVSPLTVLER